MNVRKQYKVSIQDGKDWVFMYLETDLVPSTYIDYDEVCRLDIGYATFEFEGDYIECEEIDE